MAEVIYDEVLKRFGLGNDNPPSRRKKKGDHPGDK